jgi:hypothetical protein
MPVVLAWIVLALTTLSMAQTLIKLTIGRAKPEMTEPGARSKAWSNFRWGLLLFNTGLAILAEESKNDAAEWVTRLATFALLSMMLAIWLRSRRGKSADRDHRSWLPS